MPLLPGKENIGHNIKEMQKAGHPHDQAVAAAMHESRMKRGGKLGVMRSMKLHEPHPTHVPHDHGLFHTSGPGRTDNLKISVPHNSYIIPADVVSGLGQGNTLAGARALDSITGVSGNKTPGSSSMKEPGHFASGGRVPIVVAGGEYHISPEAVKRIGRGSILHGHQILDEFVKHVRSKSVKETKDLPGPKQ